MHVIQDIAVAGASLTPEGNVEAGSAPRVRSAPLDDWGKPRASETPIISAAHGHRQDNRFGEKALVKRQQADLVFRHNNA
jgi:hypothetical protein